MRVVERLLTEFAQIHVNAAEKAKRMYSEEDIISLLDFVNNRLPDLYSRFSSEEEFDEWSKQFKTI
jgi:cell division septum initiation protein DivIVA